MAWDIDGTLVDSEPLHHRVLLEVCLDHSLDLRADPAERFLGVHMDDVWLALAPQLPGVPREAWMAQIQDNYCARVARDVAPMPRAAETVRALFAAGVPQVAVSNSGRRVVEANLGALGVREQMKGVVSLDDVTRGKPAPEPYLRGAALLGLRPEHVLVVEDSATGAASGQAAGMQVAFLGDPPGGARGIAGLPDVAAMMGL
ncbi:HAD family hydrolase [Roseivivax sediminis]|uniref:HAD family hydrolase n=1 Tax=Roseivivax sediminis TaxID=936889 RepID=UPI00165F0A8B|nr:HAD family phosphatase [Roseivivax sediminis]